MAARGGARRDGLGAKGKHLTHALLAAAGWRVLRFTDRQRRAEPGGVTEILHRLLAGDRQAGGAVRA